MGPGNTSPRWSRITAAGFNPGGAGAKDPWLNPAGCRSLQLRYAQVVKSYRRRRLVDVKHRVVFGTREAIETDTGQARLDD